MDTERLKNMDWMYAKPKLDLDDYMLGKKIDKQLIKHVLGDDEDEKASTSVGASFQDPGLNPTYDQLCKLREDPLVAIKKAEQAKAREMVDNPVLMKKFKTYLIQMANEEKSGKKSKKRKKKRSRSRSHSRDRDSSKKSKKDTKRSSRSRSRSSDRGRNSSWRNHKGTYSESQSRDTSSSKRDRNYPHSSNHNTSHNTSSSKFKRQYVPPKMSAEELERKRQQMMEDAKIHEASRETHLKRHQQSMEEEEKAFKQSKYKEDPTRFVSTKDINMDMSERIRTKLSTLQRTKSATEKFLQR